MATTQDPKGSPTKNDDLLSSFLASADSFAEKISAQIASVPPEGADRTIIEATGKSFTEQTRKLTDYVRKVGSTLSAVQRRSLEEFLQVQDGEAMVGRTIDVAAKVLTSRKDAVSRGFFGWLQESENTIKKDHHGHSEPDLSQLAELGAKDH